MLLRWLTGREDAALGYVESWHTDARRLVEAEAYTERQAWSHAGPVRREPTAAQRARAREAYE